MKLRLAIAAALFVGGMVAGQGQASANGHTNPFYTSTPFNDWCWSSWSQSASRQPCPTEAWGPHVPGYERCEGQNGPFFEFDENGIIIALWCEEWTP